MGLSGEGTGTGTCARGLANLPLHPLGRKHIGGDGLGIPDHHQKHFTCVESCWEQPAEQFFLSNNVSDTRLDRNERAQAQFGFGHRRH